jgi:DNA-binding LacI/PurR family transcriptional regulator
LREAGLRVPQDVSMATFDEMPLTTLIEPFFTVVAQPAYAMGQQAMQLLLARLQNGDAGECQEVILPFELIARRSSGPAPGAE